MFNVYYQQYINFRANLPHIEVTFSVLLVHLIHHYGPWCNQPILQKLEDFTVFLLVQKFTLSCTLFNNILGYLAKYPQPRNAIFNYYIFPLGINTVTEYVMILLPKICDGQKPVGLSHDAPTCSGGSKLTALHQLCVENMPPKSDT